jgi:hypothetical protein
MSPSDPARSQFCPRLAGFLFLWLIVSGVGGAWLVSDVAGSGELADVARRVAAHEHLYRLGLVLELVETLSAVLLGFALYATLRRVDGPLALLAMIWRVAEALLGAIAILFAFTRLRLYTGGGPSEPLIALTRGAGSAAHDFAVLCFSFGSLLFFWLFWRSRSIPRILSGIGILASVLVAVIGFADLLAPELSGFLQYGWAPMALAEVGGGLWLLVKGANFNDMEATRE